MNEPVTLLGTPNIHFLSLIIIGGLAGWIAGNIVGWRHGLVTNILVGIVGSWVGSEIASMAGFAIYGSLRQFVAALVGSIVVLGRPCRGGTRRRCADSPSSDITAPSKTSPNGSNSAGAPGPVRHADCQYQRSGKRTPRRPAGARTEETS